MVKQTTLDEFLDAYNHGPFDLEEVAFAAARISDMNTLRLAARNYRKASKELQRQLDAIGFEFG